VLPTAPARNNSLGVRSPGIKLFLFFHGQITVITAQEQTVEDARLARCRFELSNVAVEL
jgi:hypothetical protein